MFVFTLTAALASTDTDNDTVPDALDLCPWEDDTVDLDQNGHPDCDETWFDEWGQNGQGAVAAWMANADNGTSFKSWFATDGGGYAQSGSIKATGGNDAHWATLTTAQCIRVFAGRDYIAGLHHWGLGNGDYEVRAQIVQYSGPQCNGDASVVNIRTCSFDNCDPNSTPQSSYTSYSPTWGVGSIRLRATTVDFDQTLMFSQVMADNPLFYEISAPSGGLNDTEGPRGGGGGHQ